MHSNRYFSKRRAVVSAALSLGLAFSSVPAIALADDASTQNVEQVSEDLTQLYIDAEQSQYDLINVSKQLEQTEQQIADLDVRIAQSEKDLAEAKKNLSTFVSQDYKHGSVSLLDILLNASTFDEFISQVIYANKIAQHQRAAINEVDDLYSQLLLQKSELEKAKADQELFLAEQQVRAEAVVEADQATQAFIEALSPEMVEQLASVDAEKREEAMQASMEALSSMDESQLESILAAAGATEGTSGGSDTASTSSASTSSASTASTSSSTSSSASTSSSSYSDLLSRVYSLLGSGYQWSGYNYTGDTSSSSFTCSGVVDYALGRESQSSSPETLYEEVGSNLTTDVSQLKEGDLVFYSYGDREVGHVGVYVGNGQVIDSIPDGGVAVRDVDYMDVVGGGSLG